MLDSLELLPVYDSADYDLVRELQVPLLGRSVDYLRGVGFFTSGWLRVASEGVARFVGGGGRARLVVSPILERGDWEALQLGEAARFDARLKSLLDRRIDELFESLERDTLSALAWMVADRVLDMRFAIPRDLGSSGVYHDKVAVFRDRSGSTVVLHGSLNDSVQGTLNGEAFSVFQSWVPGQQPYAMKHVERLEGLWGNTNPQFRVSQVPEAIRERLVQLRQPRPRPYALPRATDDHATAAPPQRALALRPYQNEAITAWNQAGCVGLFEMATGTGKTITALAAAADRLAALGKLAVIVLVPYLHLLEQWERDCRAFGFTPVLCSGSHSRWHIEVRSQIQDFRIGARAHVCILAVHMTGASERFRESIARLRPEQTLLIGDEAHGLGAKQLRNSLTDRAGLRLGLSATPRRWYDEEGTSAIFSYFGGTCFEYPLEAAIGTYLTPYRYYPEPVSLTEDEHEDYANITASIAALAHKAEDGDDADDPLKRLLLRRARLVASAQNKIPAAVAVLRTLAEADASAGRETRGVLVYCAAGTHREALGAVADLGLRCHEFVHHVGLPERERLLRQFAEGDIQVLVAVRCLDEGVDVPATRTALVLSSSTNPREFVQRRGRILRLSPGKTEAVIHDFLVLPPSDRRASPSGADVSILRREMPRFVEFASAAQNEFEARAVVRDLLDRCQMLDLLDAKPWDVYHTLREWDWSADGQEQ